MRIERKRIKAGGNSKKGRQQAHNKSTGKYRRQFLRTVNRTGRWRGSDANILRAY